MRHVLFDLAERSGLEMARFAEDFDGGVAKGQVLEEARAGWERLKVEGSPTLVLPSGEQVSSGPGADPGVEANRDEIEQALREQAEA